MSNKKNFLLIIILAIVILLGVTLKSYFSSGNSGKIALEKKFKAVEKTLEHKAVTATKSTINSLDSKPTPNEKPAVKKAQQVARKINSQLALNHSDKVVLSSVATLLPTKNDSSLISADNIINRFVVFTDNLAHGKVVRTFSPLLKPKAPFAVYDSQGSMILDPAGYKRYDSYANIIEKLDLKKVMKEYQRYVPLINQSYKNIGYDHGDFTKTFIKAINNINNAPIITHKIQLVAPSAMYKFADSNLEKLNDVQKLMIRMGPSNTKKIQTKLAKLKMKLISSMDK